MNTKKILIVEDEIDASYLAEISLQEAKYDTVVKEDGGVALQFVFDELAANRKIDLIVLDLILPGLHGIEVARKLFENDGTKSIPIVVLSSSSPGGFDIDDLTNIRDYLRKPCEMSDLINSVNKLLQGGHGCE